MRGGSAGPAVDDEASGRRILADMNGWPTIELAPADLLSGLAYDDDEDGPAGGLANMPEAPVDLLSGGGPMPTLRPCDWASVDVDAVDEEGMGRAGWASFFCSGRGILTSTSILRFLAGSSSPAGCERGCSTSAYALTRCRQEPMRGRETHLGLGAAGGGRRLDLARRLLALLALLLQAVGLELALVVELLLRNSGALLLTQSVPAVELFLLLRAARNLGQRGRAQDGEGERGRTFLDAALARWMLLTLVSTGFLMPDVEAPVERLRPNAEVDVVEARLDLAVAVCLGS